MPRLWKKLSPACGCYAPIEGTVADLQLVYEPPSGPHWTGKRPERAGAFAGHWAQAGMPPWSSVGILFWPSFPFVTRQMSEPEALTGWARGWVSWGCRMGP